ncbi:MAG: ACP S-malonyltransferase [Gammaproteobacteria bacterium]
MVFPGQGSQAIGMLADCVNHPALLQVFGVVSGRCGQDLRKLAMEGPAERLGETTVTQPLMLAADVAFYEIYRAAGGRLPEVLAGHSLGEYPALYAAGVLDLAELADLVLTRAQLMQAAVPEGQGAMAAIMGLEVGPLVDLCSGITSGTVEAVNFNCPGQIVVAGTKTAVGELIERARAAGAKRAIFLPVSVPAHSSLMREPARQFEAVLAGTRLRPPRIPLIHNADLATHADPDGIRRALAAQLYRPVRWTDTIHAFRDHYGIFEIIECGPGRVLSGLGRRCAPDLSHVALENASTLKQYAQSGGGSNDD